MTSLLDVPRVAPSILAADFGRLREQVAEVLDAGARVIHVDVMDGHFVPVITLGPAVVKAIAPAVHERGGALDVHLMIEHPERFVDAFATAGADAITVHYEVCANLHRTLASIRTLDCRSGAAINPRTPAGMLDDVLELCDLALVMTIDPGFGGQSLIPRTLHKVEQIRREVERQGLDTEVEVDGGVDATNAKACVDAGADVLVAGTAVFGHKDGPRGGIAALQRAVTAAGATG